MMKNYMLITCSVCRINTYALVDLVTISKAVCKKCSKGDPISHSAPNLKEALDAILTEYLCRVPYGKPVMPPNQIEIIRRCIKNIPLDHLKTLALKKQRCVSVDDYGGTDIDSNRWHDEIVYYIKKYIYKDHLDFKGDFFAICIEIIDSYITLIPSVGPSDNVPDDPVLFEKYCADILASLGWTVSTTKSSGDFGADIKAVKNGKILVVQCKLYSSPVGIKAVQEIVAAVRYYNAHQAAVVSNISFTSAAKELAALNNVILCNYSQLQDRF